MWGQEMIHKNTLHGREMIQIEIVFHPNHTDLILSLKCPFRSSQIQSSSSLLGEMGGGRSLAPPRARACQQ